MIVMRIKRVLWGFGGGVVALSIYATPPLEKMHQLLQQRKGAVTAQVISKTKGILFDRPTIDRAIQFLSGHYQLVLFYRATCPHCKRFDPVLADFSRRSGISVMPFTTDGVALPSFPHSKPVSRQLLTTYFGQGAAIKVPVVFLLHGATGHIFPVSIGELSRHAFRARMHQLAPKVLAYEAAFQTRFSQREGEQHESH